jgi:hypothetical protein
MDGGGDRHPRQVEKIVIGQHLQFRLQHQAQLIAQGQIRAIGRFLFSRYPRPQLIEDFGEQLFLAREVVVHGALRHASGGGDFVHAGDVETVGTKFGNRRLDDGFAFTVSEALWSCHKYA